ncbi:hypothetical protein [Clostridium thermobutyricum]|uniref:TcaA NTF2-like domain-containing protein n=1 Tax=Clostridium thermobutyricum TaxID=29372 RepID=UPI0029425636|nr:hypothetical protein [Clostridium thermobutyricum]
MRFCKKCGAELKGDEKFCKGCGEPLNIENGNSNIKSNLGNENKKDKNSKVKLDKSFIKNKPLSKKVIGAIAGVLLLVLVCGFTLFKTDSPEKVVEKFYNGISEENVKDLKKILSAEDENLELNDDNIKILIDSYKNNLADLNLTVEELNSQAVKIKFNPIDFGSSIYNEVNLVKKKSGLREKYYINISSRYITFGEKLDGADYIIKYNGETIETKTDSDKIGPLVPGSYEIEGKLKNDYVDLDDLKSVDLCYGEKVKEVSLFENINKTTIKCNEKEATLIIDGVKTNKKMKDIDTIVGLENGTVVQAVIEKDGKIRTSNKERVYNSREINLEVEQEKVIDYNEYSKEVPKVIQEYLNNFANAVNYNDFSYVEDYLYPGSQIYKEQVKNIKGIYDSEISEKYVTSYIKSNKFDDSKKEWTVIVDETYDITKDGKTNRKSFTNEYKLKVNEEEEEVQLTEIKVNVG